MAKSEKEIAAAIRSFQPIDDEWLPLDALLQDLMAQKVTADGIDALFSVFERFPTEDGYGVFWTILHALEGVPAYESHLARSVHRLPCEFNLTMVNRMLNSGIKEVGAVSLRVLLEGVLRNEKASAEARAQAVEILDEIPG